MESVPLQGEQLALHVRGLGWGGGVEEGGRGSTYCLPTPKRSSKPATHATGVVIIHLTNEEIGLTSFRNLPEVPEDRTESARPGGSLESCVTFRLFTCYVIIASVLVQDSNVQSLVLGVRVGWGWEWELFYQRGEGSGHSGSAH